MTMILQHHPSAITQIRGENPVDILDLGQHAHKCSTSRHSQTTHLVSFAPSTTVAYPTSLLGPHASGHPEIGEPLSVIDQTFANFFSNLEEELAYTKLHQAVLNEQVDEVKALLSRGTPIDVPDRKGNLPVHYTAGHQDEKIAKFLLGYRVGKIEPLVKQDLARLTLDHRNTDGNTPMHLAISARSLNYDHQRSIVTHLLGAGANPYIPNNLGVTPIQKAVELVSPTMSWDHGHHIDKMLTAKAPVSHRRSEHLCSSSASQIQATLGLTLTVTSTHCSGVF